MRSDTPLIWGTYPDMGGEHKIRIEGKKGGNEPLLVVCIHSLHRTNKHAHPHTHFLSLSRSSSVCLSLSLSLSLTHTHAHARQATCMWYSLSYHGSYWFALRFWFTAADKKRLSKVSHVCVLLWIHSMYVLVNECVREKIWSPAENLCEHPFLFPKP